MLFEVLGGRGEGGWCSLLLLFKLLSHILLCILIWWKLDAVDVGLALDTNMKLNTKIKEDGSVE